MGISSYFSWKVQEKISAQSGHDMKKILVRVYYLKHVLIFFLPIMLGVRDFIEICKVLHQVWQPIITHIPGEPKCSDREKIPQVSEIGT